MVVTVSLISLYHGGHCEVIHASSYWWLVRSLVLIFLFLLLLALNLFPYSNHKFYWWNCASSHKPPFQLLSCFRKLSNIESDWNFITEVSDNLLHMQWFSVGLCGNKPYVSARSSQTTVSFFLASLASLMIPVWRRTLVCPRSLGLIVELIFWIWNMRPKVRKRQRTTIATGGINPGEKPQS